jgi:dipeptidyl aminopeptidase/acylaminoacyl peptidase
LIRLSQQAAWKPLATIALIAFIAITGCGGRETPTTPTSSPSPPSPGPGRVEVTIAASGASIGAYLFRPSTSDPQPAIVVLHGWQPAGTNGAALVESRARRYADEGYVALAVSLRGWPPSSGADDCGLRQPDDVTAVVTWLRSQAGVIADRIAIVGFSQGGQVALLAAGRNRLVRAVIAYYPVTDVARWKTTTTNPDIPGYVTAVCEPGGVQPRSPALRAGDIEAPVLLVHGDQDTRVPTEQSHMMRAALAAAGRSVELLLVPDAQHGFTSAEEALARPAVDRFLSQHLR